MVNSESNHGSASVVMVIPSLVLERVTPNPRITLREPLTWVIANAEWECAIPTSMVTP